MRSTSSYRQKPQHPRRPRHFGGHALILTLSLLPVLAWLSWDMLARATHLRANSVIYTEISALRAATWRDLADAMTAARGGSLQAGVTHSRNGDITVTRSVADITPNKANPDGVALTGFVVDSVAHTGDDGTENGDTAITLRMSFLFRADDLPAHGRWHVLAQ